MHEWLRENVPVLYNFLDEKLKSGVGCRAASSYMMDVYRAIVDRGDGQKFHDFIMNRFPFVVDGKPAADLPMEDPNIHHVFRRYKPHLRRFPQQYIIVDSNRAELEKKLMSFIRGKVGVDYIVIEDRAYVEYFLSRFSEVVQTVPVEKREIYAYKRRHQK